jgi:G:T/U-mismatch repair DNA glycosylase
MSHVEVAAIDQLIHHTAIQRIFLNGQTAARLFAKHFPNLMSMATVLPSTSPANARRSLEDLIEDWRAFLAYI